MFKAIVDRKSQLSPLLFSLTLLVLPILVKSSNYDELQILIDLKNSLQKSNPEAFKSWVSTNSKCNFTGIACNMDGWITQIELSQQRLSGTLPVDQICKLQYVEKLSFGFNSLYGQISESLNSCVKLIYLDLGNCFFTGPVPNLSNLTSLRYLYLNNSGFSGTFPWNSLNNMTSLVSLSIGDNFFHPSPFPEGVFNLHKLDWLYLSNSSIQGIVPLGIGNLVELRNLEMSDNFLWGQIPPDIVKLTELWEFNFFNNNFTGTFPVGFGNLSNLEYFDASQNSLEGDLYELRLLTNLISLQLFENRFTGTVPIEFGEFRRLVNLSLYTNGLTGSLPINLGSWAEFNFIDVSENYLTGSIPPYMCKQGKMKKLLMLQNNFTGQIPSNYGSCTTLNRFRVNNNSLTGIVPPGIWSLPGVTIIDIGLNKLEGPITSDIAKAASLAQLLVGDNRLSGELPLEISKAVSLVAMDLSNNNFSGEIPLTIGNLKILGSFHLENNNFSGRIPTSLGSCKSLTEINIACNSLSGEIPPSLGLLRTLNSLNLTRNRLSGQLPEKLSSVGLSLLDLSNNELTGPIPAAISIEVYNVSLLGNVGLCTYTASQFPRCRSNAGVSKEYRVLIGCFTSALLVLLVLLSWFVSVKTVENKTDRSLKDDTWNVKAFHSLSFTEDKIIEAIREDNVIGKGGSGNVYRVVNDGVELAVKHIWNSVPGSKTGHASAPMLSKGVPCRSREFEAEVRALSSVRHVNVVKLYCSITGMDSSLLVYEYLPNGSLWELLHTSRKVELGWEQRYEIALGAAKGLEYLHHGCGRPMIHRDVKSSNILLDQFLKPKIADFGLSKIVKPRTGNDTTHVIAGTIGYLAPEYGYTSNVNEKSDVYSFGVVLMELVIGKRPIEPEYGESKDIVNWVFSKLKSQDSVIGVVDPTIMPHYMKEEAIKVLRISILCTARLPEQRPTMRAVVKMLDAAEPCKLESVIILKEQSDLVNKL